MDAYIGIRGATNSNQFADVPAEKMDLYQKHWWQTVHTEVRVPRTKWVESNALAFEHGMDAYSAFRVYAHLTGKTEYAGYANERHQLDCAASLVRVPGKRTEELLRSVQQENKSEP